MEELMREYTHVTRECLFEELQTPMVTAIREFIQQHQPTMQDCESKALVCVETTTIQTKIGFVERLSGLSEKLHYTGALLTPEFVIWATCGPQRKTSLLAARLVDIEITRLDYTGERDPGLDLFGLMIDGKERIRVYIALGDDAAGQNFKRIFGAALEKAVLEGG
jgi:hypothetical protein